MKESYSMVVVHLQQVLYANLSADSASKLSYDEVTDSVYVGFASNVDELSGIAVINKESGGAASALDSHDGLVVKED